MVREFSNIYDFYNLSDEEAHELIGHVIHEVLIVKKGRQKHKIIREYIPIGLKNKWVNYGKPTGLLYFSEIFKTIDYEKWFRIGSFSPDDLDIDLDFTGEETKLRNKIKEYTLSLPLYDTDYIEVLKIIQEEFKAGSFT